MRISDWSSDVCSSDLVAAQRLRPQSAQQRMHFARRLPQQAAEAARIVEAQHPAAAAARPRERDVEVVVDTHRRVGRKHPQTAGHAQVQQRAAGGGVEQQVLGRSEEHTSELQSLMRIPYAVFCWKKKIT